jgi:predicted O-methyltransferase YrrM
MWWPWVHMEPPSCRFDIATPSPWDLTTAQVPGCRNHTLRVTTILAMSKMSALGRRTGLIWVDWQARGNLTEVIGGQRLRRPRPTSHDKLIKSRIAMLNRVGPKALWSGYGEGPAAARTPGVVSSPHNMGRFYSELVIKLQPTTVVEFGGAFGVSGMHWLAGLEANKHGQLLSFEVNPTWAEIAGGNLDVISTRATLTVDTFENAVDRVLKGRSIDLAFIDAIHTSEFVESQFELVAERMTPRGVVILDDIDFSADMHGCWERISRGSRVIAAARVTNRVGMVQLA